jgi:hypothetical protein
MYTELEESANMRDLGAHRRGDFQKRIMKFPNSKVIFAGNSIMRLVSDPHRPFCLLLEKLQNHIYAACLNALKPSTGRKITKFIVSHFKYTYPYLRV